MGCPITACAYDDDISVDQPSSVTDAAGATTWFHYNTQGAQDASWYEHVVQESPTVLHTTRVTSITEYDEMGRTMSSSRRVHRNIGEGTPAEETTEVVLSRTIYNSIGKVDYSIDENGSLIKYEYDKTGNLVETRTYASEADYTANNLPLTISQTLYDKEGRTLVSVGPYEPDIYEEDPAKWPVGSETVYDSLGRVSETRRWPGVRIDLADLLSRNVVVGKQAAVPTANAYTTTPPPTANIGWTSNAAVSQKGNELSYSRSEYDLAGRVWLTYRQDETGTEHCIDEYAYDRAGKQISVTNLPGQTDETVTETNYDGLSRDWVKDGRANTTYFAYDEVGRLVLTTYPDTEFMGSIGAQPTYSYCGYDGLGRKNWETQQTALTDPANVPKKEFTYDAAGRLLKVELPAVDDPEDNPDAGETVRPIYHYIYDEYGNTVAQIDPRNRITIFRYNELGLQTHKYQPFVVAEPLPTTAAEVYALDLTGRVYELKEYDCHGRLTWVTDHIGQKTGYEYDLRGRLEYNRYYETGQSLPTESVQYSYDGLGRRETVSTGSDTYGYTYDAEGRTTYVSAPQGIVGYGYNPVTGGKTNTWTANTEVGYGYDELGRLKTVSAAKVNGQTLASPKTSTYEYDLVGSRLWTRLPNGASTHYSYDAANRLNSVRNFQQYESDPENPTGGTLSRYDYKVYPNGRRAYSTEADGTEVAWLYDAAGRLTDESYFDSANCGYTANYSYDLVGNRKTREIRVTRKEGGIPTAGPVLKTEYDYCGTDRLYTETFTEYAPTGMLQGGRQIYAAAGPGHGVRYIYADGQPALWQFGALLFGLPSSWSEPLFYVLMVLVPLVLFGPAILRMAKAGPLERHGLRGLWRQGVCVMLAYSILLTGGVIESLAYGTTVYDNLELSVWGSNGKTISYLYDDNGSLTSKTTRQDGVITELVEYVYDLQGRLASATTTPYYEGSPETPTITEYGYNEGGIRTSKTEGGVATTYIVDSYNPTGYAQVLEETTAGVTTSYILGDDVIAQHTAADGFEYLLYDGHGSTRQLVTDSQTLRDSYSYDAYGVQTSGGSETSLKYSGEQYDSSLSQYYLRARYYDQSNGRFTTLDPYSGNTSDPQSLHKYTYCHNDPMNGIDPGGLSLRSELGVHIHGEIAKMYKAEHLGLIFTNEGMPRWSRELFPDIMDFTMKEIAEIKPLSPYGVGAGLFQLTGYLAAANYSKIAGATKKLWTPSSWAVGVREIPLPPYAKNYFAVTICNALGVIFYKVFRIPTDLLKAVVLASLVSALADKLADIAERLKAMARQGYGSLEGSLASLSNLADSIFTMTYAQRLGQSGLHVSNQYMLYGIMALFTTRILLTTVSRQLV